MLRSYGLELAAKGVELIALRMKRLLEKIYSNATAFDQTLFGYNVYWKK